MKGLVPFNYNATTIGVSAGSVGNASFTTPITKNLSSWTAGSGNGGVDGGSIPANAWGHIFSIYNPSTSASDILLSGSAYNPVLPSGFTEKQILNSFLIDSSGGFRQGQWRDDGSFDLSVGVAAFLNESLTNIHLMPAGCPLGLKLRARGRVVTFNLVDSGNPGFYVLAKDPDSYPTQRLVGEDIDTSAAYDKIAGINGSQTLDMWTDCMGQVFVGAHASVAWANNKGHIYTQGWWHPRETDHPTVTIGIVGASLTMDRNANNWPNVVARQLTIGKQSQVKMLLAGQEGKGSNDWIAAGWHSKVALARPHIAIIDGTADANPGFGISTAQALANLYTMIDAIRANNSSVPIFLFKANHMRSDATQFANVLNYYANYATVQANRSNISIIDTYTPWGDPALHPSEYDAVDPIHPLYAGSSRVTIPTTVTALSSYIT